MYVLIKMYVNFFKMLISFGIVIVSMMIDRIQIGVHLVYIPLILVVLFLVTFGFGLIFMHFGVFIEDLSNVVTVLLRLVFYMSGVFYSIESKLGKLNHVVSFILEKVNPVALVISSLRDVMLYNRAPDVLALLVWLVAGVLISALGIYTVYRYENSYTKVI